MLVAGKGRSGHLMQPVLQLGALPVLSQVSCGFLELSSGKPSRPEDSAASLGTGFRAPSERCFSKCQTWTFLIASFFAFMPYRYWEEFGSVTFRLSCSVLLAGITSTCPSWLFLLVMRPLEHQIPQHKVICCLHQKNMTRRWPFATRACLKAPSGFWSPTEPFSGRTRFSF